MINEKEAANEAMAQINGVLNKMWNDYANDDPEKLAELERLDALYSTPPKS